MSKGSRQRPTNKATFDANFDRIFRNKDKDKDVSRKQPSSKSPTRSN